MPLRDRLTYGVEYSDATLAALRAVRPRLLERYRQMSDEALMVHGIVLAARKPAVRANN